MSVSAPTASIPAAGRAGPPPGTGAEAFPGLAVASSASHGDGDDGDDLLDALLGLEVSGAPSSSAAKAASGNGGGGGGSGGGGGGVATFEEEGSHEKRTFSEVASVPGAGGAGDDGDSMLDALLGLEIEPAPTGVVAGAAAAVATPAESGNGGGGATSSGSDRRGTLGVDVRATLGIEGEASFGVDATGSARGGSAAAEKQRGSARSKARDELGGGEGAVAMPSPPPFEGAELGRLCTHLNDRNRRAKRLAQRCQEMFLRLFFKVWYICVV